MCKIKTLAFFFSFLCCLNFAKAQSINLAELDTAEFESVDITSSNYIDTNSINKYQIRKCDDFGILDDTIFDKYTEFKIGDRYTGVYWIILRVEVPENRLNTPIVLNFDNESTPFEIFYNKKRISSGNGIVSGDSLNQKKFIRFSSFEDLHLVSFNKPVSFKLKSFVVIYLQLMLVDLNLKFYYNVKKYIFSYTRYNLSDKLINSLFFLYICV